MELDAEPEWRKAIAPERDRRQSQGLVGLVGSGLVLLAVGTLAPGFDGHPDDTLWPALAISAVFALAVWGVKAATPWAAAFGGIICLLVTCWTSSFDWTSWTFGWATPALHSCLTPLMVLFVLTFLATRAGKRQKIATGLAEGKRGRKTSQVIANLGFAGVLAPLGRMAWGWWVSRSGAIDVGNELVQVLVLAALAEATADTVSSEIGQAFGGPPFLLTTMRRVEPGTDGAVSLIGTLHGVAASALVVASGVWAMGLPLAGAWVSLSAGVGGLCFDSLMGATMERRGRIGNDWVNFLSTAFSAGLALFCLSTQHT